MNPISRQLRDLRLLPYWIIMTAMYAIVLLMAFSLIGGGLAVTLALAGLILFLAGWLIVTYPLYAGLIALLIGAASFRQWVRSRS